MADDLDKEMDQEEKQEEKIHNVVKRWDGLYAELLSYRSNNWDALWEADPKELLLIKKMLKKAVPQVKREYDNQKRRLASNPNLAKRGKKIGAKRISEKRDKILKEYNDGSISKERKDALIAELSKNEERYKKQADDHTAGTSWLKRRKKWVDEKEQALLVRMQKYGTVGATTATILETDYVVPLTFFLIYTIYFWQFAQLSFLTAIGFGVFGWIISTIVDKSGSTGVSFCMISWIFVKWIGLSFLTNPIMLLVAVVAAVFTQIISQSFFVSMLEKKGRIWKRLIGFGVNFAVFGTIILVIYPIFSQLIQLTDMGMSQKSNNLTPFLNPIKKGLNSTMTLLTDPMKWYQDYFIKKDVEKTEGVQSKALKITGMRTYLPTYYSGDAGGGSIELENFGEKPARNVKVVVYIPNDINKLMEYQGIASVLNWISPEQITYTEMDIARVSMSGASRIDEIDPKQPVTVDFDIKTPATCTGAFTVISKAVYDYNMDTIGTLNVASKAKYDELSKAGKLRREQMKTTSASGPISISMKTMTPMPISVDKKFAFIITPLNLDTGTARLNSFYVYIPEDFNVYTYKKTGEYGCAFSECKDCPKEDGYEAYMVELHGTSNRCFSNEIGNLYSCHIQLKPEAASKVIDTAEYSFKAKISYSYALKSSVQFNVINSIVLGAREYKKCPQQATYKDNYELLTCDKSRDYYYLCNDSIWDDIKNWAKDTWSFSDDLKHCFDYTSDIGIIVEEDLGLDMAKLKAIGNTATYLASRADVEPAVLSAIDNEFLDNAAIIASDIDTYAILAKMSLIENNDIDNDLKEDIKERVNGMINYTYSAYFLAEKNYNYDSMDYAHWEKDHIITVGEDIYTARTLPLIKEDMENLRPAGKVTKADENIIFMGNKYVLATGALNRRLTWLNLIDYSDDCDKHYIDGPTNTRFCVKRKDFSAIEQTAQEVYDDCLDCCEKGEETKKEECIKNCSDGKGVCFDDAGLIEKGLDWVSDKWDAITDTITAKRQEEENRISEITTLISDLQKTQQEVKTIINDKAYTEDNFNNRIEPLYEINKILNDSVVPCIIGVEIKKISPAETSCHADYPDRRIIGTNFDPEIKYDVCLKYVGKLCGKSTGKLTLEELYNCLFIDNPQLKELADKINYN
ncbi:MAG: hypothetical protein DRN66_01805 [Candidatus Nanohalarchaeota archaeon]|nr:MAG: hypothetical protein DRN66_01805 [Candidatus Nanohaloarchaeota archaeon]